MLRHALKTLSAIRGPKLSIFIFHRVLSEPDPLFPGEIDIARFDRIVGWISSWFDVLPLSEAVERLSRGDLGVGKACITFDDGYADNLTNATPVLRKHNAHATFFIATDFIDGGRMWNDTVIESIRGTAQSGIDCEWLGLGDVSLDSVADRKTALERIIPAIKHLPGERRAEAVSRLEALCGASLPNDLMLSALQLSDLHGSGMGIGAHTRSHPILAKTDPARARREISESRAYLENALGERIGLFAYPNGKPGVDYLPEHVAMVKDLGFDAAVSTAWGASRPRDSLFELKRFTPWDTTRGRFGLRVMKNLAQAHG